MISITQTHRDLTQREHEILALIAHGFSSKQIAEMLCISRNTVSNHRKNMRVKMGVQSTIELLERVE